MKLIAVFVLAVVIAKAILYFRSETPENEIATQKVATVAAVKPQVLALQSSSKVERKTSIIKQAKKKRDRKRLPEESAEESQKEEKDWYKDTWYEQEDGDESFFLSKEEIEKNFPNGVPKKFNMTKNSRSYRFVHPNGEGAGDGKGKTLYSADHKTMANHARERKNALVKEPVADSTELGDNLPNDAFFVNLFEPGFIDNNRKYRVKKPADPYKRVARQDYVFEDGSEEYDPMDPRTQEAIKEAQKTVVSLGNGGGLYVTVAEQGVVANLANEDFTVFENVFKIKDEHEEYKENGQDYFYELAYVEVSADGKSYYRFPCDKDKPFETGSYCAGTVLSSEGGNTFDLSWLGNSELLHIRKISVVDTGDNYTRFVGYTRPDAAGADIDAVELHHAYLQ